MISSNDGQLFSGIVSTLVRFSSTPTTLENSGEATGGDLKFELKSSSMSLEPTTTNSITSIILTSFLPLYID